MNFTEYWGQNKELFEQLGVTKAVVRKIWCDSANNIEKLITKHYINKLKCSYSL